MAAASNKVMTHSDLIERAVLWLLGRGRCSIAFSEMQTAGSWEIPDAIGFNCCIPARVRTDEEMAAD